MQALSKASLDEVNEAWAGLGYYRRARFLLEGAQAIAAQAGGAMPLTAHAWLKIPGRCPALHALIVGCQGSAGFHRGTLVAGPWLLYSSLHHGGCFGGIACPAPNLRPLQGGDGGVGGRYMRSIPGVCLLDVVNTRCEPMHNTCVHPCPAAFPCKTMVFLADFQMPVEDLIKLLHDFA